jgi:hypothetical protein
MGISERDFWSMSFAELNRELASRKRRLKTEAMEKASFDYILADLIGRSIGRLYSSSNKYPDISSVYPSLFDSEEIQEQKAKKQDELSVIRFKQFADTFNAKFMEVKQNE